MYNFFVFKPNKLYLLCVDTSRAFYDTCLFLSFYRHKKEKKKDKERDRDRKSDKEYSREEHEHSTSKKKKSKDKERERKSDGEKGDVKVGIIYLTDFILTHSELWCCDVNQFCAGAFACHACFLPQITRDYDEEEQGYDSEKEREDRKDSDDSALSPQSVEGNGTARKAKVNGADDRHEEDMDVSD